MKDLTALRFVPSQHWDTLSSLTYKDWKKTRLEVSLESTEWREREIFILYGFDEERSDLWMEAWQIRASDGEAWAVRYSPNPSDFLVRSGDINPKDPDNPASFSWINMIGLGEDEDYRIYYNSAIRVGWIRKTDF